jgi:hypothetical protein
MQAEKAHGASDSCRCAGALRLAGTELDPLPRLARGRNLASGGAVGRLVYRVSGRQQLAARLVAARAHSCHDLFANTATCWAQRPDEEEQESKAAPANPASRSGGFGVARSVFLISGRSRAAGDPANRAPNTRPFERRSCVGGFGPGNHSTALVAGERVRGLGDGSCAVTS